MAGCEPEEGESALVKKLMDARKQRLALIPWGKLDLYLDPKDTLRECMAGSLQNFESRPLDVNFEKICSQVMLSENVIEGLYTHGLRVNNLEFPRVIKFLDKIPIRT